MTSQCRQWLFPATVTIALMLALWELAVQYDEMCFVHAAAVAVTEEAGAVTPRDKVVALRDYLRGHITWRNAQHDDRSFLRATAMETLQSRRGYCGEVTRTFICMAGSLGISAQRVNLRGKVMHVVAEAELSPDEKVVVDCQSPPHVADLATLDDVVRGPVFTEYYTLNLRRLGIGWLVSRLKLQHGPWDTVLERPHLLKASLWGSLIVLVCGARLLRILARRVLYRIGWVHRSDVNILLAVPHAQQPKSPVSADRPTVAQPL